MKKINYYKILHKYIKPSSKTYPFISIHSHLVANKALKIANKLELSSLSLRFIEEAAMLHDIGIVKVNDEDMFCTGDKEYITHGIEGAKILRAEGLERHALVAERHTGVGIYLDDIKKFKLPIPVKDYLAESIEVKIISYADLFFSKIPESLWYEKSVDEVKKNIMRFGSKHMDTLEEWICLFEGK